MNKNLAQKFLKEIRYIWPVLDSQAFTLVIMQITGQSSSLKIKHSRV